MRLTPDAGLARRRALLLDPALTISDLADPRTWTRSGDPLSTADVDALRHLDVADLDAVSALIAFDLDDVRAKTRAAWNALHAQIDALE